MTNRTEVRTYDAKDGNTAVPRNGSSTAVRKLWDALRTRIRDKSLIRAAAGTLALMLLAFVLGGAVIGETGILHPFGLSLAAAAGTAFPAVLIGGAAACLSFGEEKGIFLASLFLLAGLRYLTERILWRAEAETADPDGELPVPYLLPDGRVSLRRVLFPPGIFTRGSAGLRTGIAVLSACPGAAGLLLTGGFEIPVLLEAGSFLLTVPVTAFLLSGVFAGRLCPPAHKEAGIGALCFALTLSVGGATVFGFSLRTVCAFLITLYIAKTGGFLRGGLCGLLCGLACDLLYAPAFAIAGAVSGVLFGIHPAPAVLFSVIASCAYAVYVGKFPALRLVVPELVVSGSLAYPVVRYLHIPDLLYSAPRGKNSPVPAEPERENEALSEQLDALSGTLASLSTAFDRLSEHGKKPTLAEVRQLCESCAEPYCRECPMRETCSSEAADAFGKITLSVHRRGRAEPGTAYEPLYSRCPHHGKMIGDINEASAKLYAEKLSRDRTEIAAGDYEGMAKLLRASAVENEKKNAEDPVLSKKLARTMARMGFLAEQVTVYGERRQTVVARGVDFGLHAVGETGAGFVAGRALLGSEELCEAFSSLAGVKYQMPDYSLSEGGRTLTMTMHAQPKLRVFCGYAGDKKYGEEVTGDSLSLFSDREDRFRIVLCDGMGSGREASVTAQISTLFLEKMLSVCCADTAALGLLNTFLRSREGECSASADLCSIDLITGDACFYKCGAAPSYLIRGESIFRIASGTMPLGILKEVNAEETAFPLCDGDILLFFSDGVCGEDEDAGWILKTARAALREGSRCPDESGEEKETSHTRGSPLDCAARSILNAAEHRDPGMPDDRTAVIARIRFL